METLQQWCDSVNGKFVDMDGAYGAQCVDEMRHYLVNCLGLPQLAIPASLYAKDIYKKFQQDKNFTKIPNGPWNYPLPGDIVFFNTYPFIYGIAGHVAIVTYADSMKLISMDQNYPTNSACHLVKHDYCGCLGWLHPIK